MDILMDRTMYAAAILHQSLNKLTCVGSEGKERTILLHKGFLGAQ